MKRIFITILLILSFSPLFARTNFTTSLGLKGQYDSTSCLSVGLHLDLKKDFFDTSLDVLFTSTFDKISIGYMAGANLFINNYIGDPYSSFNLSLLGGVDVKFLLLSPLSYISLTPIIRITSSLVLPINLELKALADLGYEIEISSGQARRMIYKFGIVMAYSFDLEEEDYAYKAQRYKD